MSDHDRPRDQAPSPRRARGHGPRRPDRHDRRRLHRHAGPAHGQARPGPGLPRRRHRHGAHFCTYLLGTDMEMNTPEGFTLMNWETGYGDWIAEPIWDQLRVLPWLPGTAMVLADTIDEETGARDPGLAADDPQAPGRARRRRRLRDQGRLGVRVLRPQGLVGGAGRARLAGPPAVRPLQRGLPPPPGDEGRAAPSPAAQPDDRGQRPDRVQQGRGGQRPARGQHPLRPRPRIGRPERRLQARRQGDRLPQRLGHHVHGQARPPLDRAHRATCT